MRMIFSVYRVMTLESAVSFLLIRKGKVCSEQVFPFFSKDFCSKTQPLVFSSALVKLLMVEELLSSQ